MSNRNLALLSNGALIIGVFCPIVTVPFLGAQNYFQNGEGDGIIVLGLAAIGFIFILKNWFRALFVTSGLSLLVSLYTFLSLLSKLNSLRDQMHAELKDNPFAGLADAAMQSVQIQWGWILLIGGATTLLIAAWNCDKEQQILDLAQKENKDASLPSANPTATEITNLGEQFAGETIENYLFGTRDRRNASLAAGAIIILSILAVIITVTQSHSDTNSSRMVSESSGPADESTNNSPSTSPASASAVPERSPQLLLSLSGSGSKSTQTISVPREWNLAWTYDCSSFGQQGNFQVFVYNSDGTPSGVNCVNQLGISGSDTEYFHEGGNLYLVVNSECRWTIRVLG